jgi:Skp family chaperone for outer membrane proteins
MKARQELCHEPREKYLRAVEDGDEAAAMYEREFREAEEALAKAQANLQRKEAALGVTKHAELQELVKSEYIRLWMNARALKLRLQEQLRARKFEMDIVERTYRRLMNGRHHDD